MIVWPCLPCTPKWRSSRLQSGVTETRWSGGLWWSEAGDKLNIKLLEDLDCRNATDLLSSEFTLMFSFMHAFIYLQKWLYTDAFQFIRYHPTLLSLSLSLCVCVVIKLAVSQATKWCASLGLNQEKLVQAGKWICVLCFLPSLTLMYSLLWYSASARAALKAGCTYRYT